MITTATKKKTGARTTTATTLSRARTPTFFPVFNLIYHHAAPERNKDGKIDEYKRGINCHRDRGGGGGEQLHQVK